MRKLFIIVLCSIAVLLAGYAGYRSYRVWKNKHLINLAHEFMAKSDERNAALALQGVLRTAPNNVEAVRMMAQLAEASHSTAALIWSSRVVELDPHSAQDRLALAQTGLAFHDYAAATNALEGIDVADKATPSYHNIAGAVAAAVNHQSEAEAHFLEASRLDPQNPAPQLNLAVVRLHGSNSVELTEARDTLQRLAVNPTNSSLRCEALRELILDDMSHKHENTAVALSDQLMRETNCPFVDRILQLEILKETRSADFKTTLNKYQREAAASPSKISELATWEMAKTSPLNALAWLRTLPANTQTNQPTTILITDCLTAEKDWQGLQKWLEKQRWAELDFTRHAFLSRALRGQDLSDAGKAEWEQAVSEANGQRQSLIMLLRLAAQWHWTAEGEELLWTVVNHYPREKWATRALTQILYADGRTRSLMQLFKQESERAPANLAVKNNLAFMALLLDANELKPHELALEVYQKAPTNAGFASTYAFSLYMQGKNAEALKVMRRLTPQQLKQPEIGGYYGLILKASGNSADAKTYLSGSTKGVMLPEERKLFENAKMGT
jgi:predicted Zn-dependent protease